SFVFFVSPWWSYLTRKGSPPQRHRGHKERTEIFEIKELRQFRNRLFDRTVDRLRDYFRRKIFCHQSPAIPRQFSPKFFIRIKPDDGSRECFRRIGNQGTRLINQTKTLGSDRSCDYGQRV